MSLSGSASGDVDPQMNQSYVHVWGDLIQFTSLTANTVLGLDNNKTLYSTTVSPGTLVNYWQVSGGSTNIIPNTPIVSVTIPNANTLILQYVSASSALYVDSSGVVRSSVTTSTELTYLSGVTSAIQTQINSKFGGTVATGSIAIGTSTANELASSSYISESSVVNGVTIQPPTTNGTIFNLKYQNGTAFLTANTSTSLLTLAATYSINYTSTTAFQVTNTTGSSTIFNVDTSTPVVTCYSQFMLKSTGTSVFSVNTSGSSNVFSVTTSGTYTTTIASDLYVTAISTISMTSGGVVSIYGAASSAGTVTIGGNASTQLSGTVTIQGNTVTIAANTLNLPSTIALSDLNGISNMLSITASSSATIMGSLLLQASSAAGGGTTTIYGGASTTQASNLVNIYAGVAKPGQVIIGGNSSTALSGTVTIQGATVTINATTLTLPSMSSITVGAVNGLSNTLILTSSTTAAGTLTLQASTSAAGGVTAIYGGASTTQANNQVNIYAGISQPGQVTIGGNLSSPTSGTVTIQGATVTITATTLTLPSLSSITVGTINGLSNSLTLTSSTTAAGTLTLQASTATGGGTTVIYGGASTTQANNQVNIYAGIAQAGQITIGGNSTTALSGTVTIQGSTVTINATSLSLSGLSSLAITTIVGTSGTLTLEGSSSTTGTTNIYGGASATQTNNLINIYAGIGNPGQVTIGGNSSTVLSGTVTIQGATVTINATTTNLTGVTASRALVTDGSSNIIASATTATQVGYLSNVTSDIQTQINSKQATITGLTTGYHIISNSSSQPVNSTTVYDSGSSMLPISGGISIGSSSAPFSTVYTNNLYYNGTMTIYGNTSGVGNVNIIGGVSTSSNNNVTISGTTTATAGGIVRLVGGYSTTQGNNVIQIFGGYNQPGIITLQGAFYSGNLAGTINMYGGISSTASNNLVNIFGGNGQAGQVVVGGNSSTATSGTVTIQGSTVTVNASTFNSTAITVPTIIGSSGALTLEASSSTTGTTTIYGGASATQANNLINIYAGIAQPGQITIGGNSTTALSGTVTIQGSTVTVNASTFNSTAITVPTIIGSSGALTLEASSSTTGTTTIYGGASATQANNLINIYAGIAQPGQVTIGGNSSTALSGTVTVQGSTVTVNGSAVNISGGSSTIPTDNTVTIASSTTQGGFTTIYGGISSTATSNSVAIYGGYGTAPGRVNIVGGSAAGTLSLVGGISSTATNNLINVQGSAAYGGYANICGGMSSTQSENIVTIFGGIAQPGQVTIGGNSLTALSGTVTVQGSTVTVNGSAVNILGGSTSTASSFVTIYGNSAVSGSVGGSVNIYGGNSTANNTVTIQGAGGTNPGTLYLLGSSNGYGVVQVGSFTGSAPAIYINEQSQTIMLGTLSTYNHYTAMLMGTGDSYGGMWADYNYYSGLSISNNFYIAGGYGTIGGTKYYPNASNGTSVINIGYGEIVFGVAGTATTPTKIVQITSGGISPYNSNSVSCGSSGNLWTAVYAINGSIQTSDERAKMNINDSPVGKDLIMRLKSRQWYYKNNIALNVNRLHHGFVYQEIKAIEQELGHNYGFLYEADTPDGSHGINYAGLMAPMVNMMQEQERELTSTKLEINQLRKQLEQVLARLGN
jgi:fibronectin-binding autotransporter adhesin